MKTFTVQLPLIVDVKNFVAAACQTNFDIDLVCGRHVIDAKSIMGVFSLDLAEPLTVQVHGTPEDAQSFYDSVKNFAASALS